MKCKLVLNVNGIPGQKFGISASKAEKLKNGQIIGKYRPALMETLGGVMRSKTGWVLKIRIRMMLNIDCGM